ncbi:AAA family ATPase [Pallidibacillus pasinlerensis]|uniref:AAA family ATPase n=1 Tax=Pallidibacillus pasinlerensis TaxID=2703818 RepID=A0ABW9ZZD9_9BACI|nr:AAA family ATPase [Pallidibacillus pasinlerensis]NCU16533.1 AAA family ATPase [Pallidibacillus pasinlerensis]
MRIKEILIYGYGKFEQFHLKFSPYHIVFGRNEAGKSTIMSFIHSILFGFPTRQQSEVRYEPKMNSKYGGQITLEMDNWGEVRIERIKGKAVGDVTVYLEDGTRGEEELLQEILGGIDKETYQSIFSFNVHGLQQIDRLKGEEISKFLFSTSAVGTDRILEAEQLIQKELDKLYKPTGVKPELNVQLNKLKQTEKKLNEAKVKIDQYEKFLDKLETVKNELVSKRERLEQLEANIIEGREWNRIYPLLIEKKNIVQQLEEIGNISFPDDGLTKLERFEHEKKSIQNRLSVLLEKQKQIQAEIDNLNVQDDVIKNKDSIELIVEDIPTYRNDEQKVKQLQVQLQQLDDEIQRLIGSLGFQGSVESVLQYNLSFARKDEVKQLSEKRNLLIEKKKELEQREEECRDKLIEAEIYIEQLRNRILKVNEQKEFEQLIENHEKQNDLSKELELINKQIQMFEKDGDSNAYTKPNVFLLSFIISLVAGILTFFFQYGGVAANLFVLSIIFLILYFTKRKGPKGNTFIDTLKKQKAQVEQQVSQAQPQLNEIEVAKQKLAANNDLLRKIEIEEIQLRSLNHQFDNIIQSFEQWETEWVNNESKMLKIGAEYNLPKQMATQFLMESFERLEQLREKLLQRNQLVKQFNLLQKNIQEKATKLERLAEQVELKGTNYQEQVLLLKQMLSEQLELLTKQSHLREKYEEIGEQIQALQTELKTIEESIAELYQVAQVDTKESFIKKGEQAKQIEQLKNALVPIEKQLLYTNIPLPYSQEQIPAKLTSQQFERMDAEKNQLQEEIEQLEKERAQLSYEIETMEEGGTYTDLLHQFHQEKFELREGVKKWAVYQTAKYALEKSMDIYKVEKLPKVIELASEYFSLLTDGNYERIQLDKEKDLLYVKRRDGMIFEPKELSQATGEQLYVSIRFALAITMSEQLKLPFLIDDGFVHFDGTRQVKMMELLGKLSQHVQILYFTCHEDYLQYFPKDQMTIIE